MLHFASSGAQRPADRRNSSFLNATQTKFQGEPMFLAIEEQLHDARRVQTHGQEDDLKAALGMVIDRVVELSTQLQEALKAKTELETQLSVAKSNLQLVIANNEMLEEAVGNARDVGWRRGNSDRRSESRARMSEDSYPPSPVVNAASPNAQGKDDSRFFKFRFNNSTSNVSTRPSTPASPVVNGHKSSSSLSSVNINNAAEGEEREASYEKVMQEKEDRLKQLMAELEKERELHRTAKEEKASLEGEIESLSAALFEEANKMVATERIRLHEVSEELKETRHEREALKSALRLIEGENKHLRSSSGTTPSSSTPSSSSSTSLPGSPKSFNLPTHSRSSSNVGIISPRSSRSPTPDEVETTTSTSANTITALSAISSAPEPATPEEQVSNTHLKLPPTLLKLEASSVAASTDILYQDIATPTAMKTALPPSLEESPWG